MIPKRSTDLIKELNGHYSPFRMNFKKGEIENAVNYGKRCVVDRLLIRLKEEDPAAFNEITDGSVTDKLTFWGKIKKTKELWL